MDINDVSKEAVLGWTSRIPWESYIGEGKSREGSSIVVTMDDVRVIKRFCDADQGAAMTEALEKDEETRRYPQCLMKVLITITDVRIIQYCLTLLEDFVAPDAAGRCKYLHKPSQPSSTRPYLLPFLQLVGTSGSGARISSLDANSYVLEHAAGLAAAVIAVDAGADPHATSSLLAWVMTHIRLYGSSVPKQVKVTEVAVSALMTLLRSDTVRGLFVEERGLERLVPLCASRNSQLLYEAGFCLWSLSLTGEYCPLLERAGAVTAVARLLRSGMPLKVLRVAAATLANVSKSPECVDSVAEICETHVPEVVAALLAGAGDSKGVSSAADGGDASAAASDPELLDDLRWLADAIASNKRRLTSLERYEKELASGRLEWTAVHGAEFWAANALAAEAGDFRLIKALGALVADPATDALTLAVALSDLGEFAVAHPQGRTVLASLGIRPAVMACLKRDEEEVKQQALLACSKLLVNKWQFVTSGGGGSGTPKA